jgi:hypothetical protein
VQIGEDTIGFTANRGAGAQYAAISRRASGSLTVFRRASFVGIGPSSIDLTDLVCRER